MDDAGTGLPGLARADVQLEHATLSSPPAAGPELRLRTTAFEVLRFRLGRRSRDQVLALDWSADPGDLVDALFVFGPRPDPLAE